MKLREEEEKRCSYRKDGEKMEAIWHGEQRAGGCREDADRGREKDHKKYEKGRSTEVNTDEKELHERTLTSERDTFESLARVRGREVGFLNGLREPERVTVTVCKTLFEDFG